MGHQKLLSFASEMFFLGPERQTRLSEITVVVLISFLFLVCPFISPRSSKYRKLDTLPYPIHDMG